MFKTIKQRFRDVSTINALCSGAEKHAKADGRKEAGAEHFVLSALELPDGTARKVFELIHADPDGFRAAIARQYEEALKNIGIALPHDSAIVDEVLPVATSPRGPIRRKPRQKGSCKHWREKSWTRNIRRTKQPPSWARTSS